MHVQTLSDDMRALRATRIRPTDSPSRSTRSSMDSARRHPGSASPGPAAGLGIVAPPQAQQRSPSMGGHAPAVDYVYLKNVLLQFLEQRDKAHQMQLVPVLGMLLKFDKRDQEKWSRAIAAR